MPRPVILQLISKAPDLGELSEELNAMKATLRPLEAQEYIQYWDEVTTELSKFESAIEDFNGRISIFHYAGHAGAKGFSTQEGAVFIQGLARQFKDKGNPLDLVFLNGCNSQQQVYHWFAAGAKAVIATTAPIGDKKARLFSEFVYYNLVQKRTLEGAVLNAKDKLNSRYDLPQTNRGIGLRDPIAKDEEAWELYLNPDFDEKKAKSFRLPWYRANELFASEVQTSLNQISKFNGSRPNLYLLNNVIPAMLSFDKNIAVEVQNARNNGALFDILVKNLPWCIGAHIRPAKMQEFMRPNRARMEVLLSCFGQLGRTLYYFLLTESWWLFDHNYLEEKPEKKIWQQKSLKDNNHLDNDYFERFRALNAFLNTHAKERFLPELAGPVFEDAVRMEKIDKALNYFAELDLEKIEQAAWLKVCTHTEFHLAQLLRVAAFLVNYKMLSVRNINVLNIKRHPRSYMHRLGQVHANETDNVQIDLDPYIRSHCLYSGSIVLLRNGYEEANEVQEFADMLSLSPFFLDLNAFYKPHDLHSESHIMLFTYAYKEGNDYYYHLADRRLVTSQDSKRKIKALVFDTSMTNDDIHELLYPSDQEQRSELSPDLDFGDNRRDDIFNEIRALHQIFQDDMQTRS